MVSIYYIEIGRIEEDTVPGKRLGRHIRHDSRNRAYPHRRSGRTLTSQLWPRHIPILDQNGYGSCTGEEQVGALGTGPLWDALSAAQRASLTQAEALKLYSAAEILDGGAGLPSEDDGSSGPSAAQAAENAGLISGYVHCFSLADVLDALETGPVGIGSNWYSSMDNPDSSGLVVISPGAYVRGGHEYVCRGKDISKQLLFFDNSWGTSYGAAGSFSYSYATLERLLAEDGDGTVSVPLTQPAPVPVPPVPVPVPTPVPTPTPTPTPVADAADQALWSATQAWAAGRHAGANRHAAQAIETWARAKHLS